MKLRLASLLILFVLGLSMVQAHGAAPPAAPQASLADAQQTLAQIRNRLPITSSDDQLATMGREAAAVEAQAQAVVAARARDLAGVDQALRPLTPPAHRTLPAAKQDEQAALLARRGPLEAQLQQAQGVATQASAAFNLIAERRRQGFTGRVLQQSASPLSPSFWTSLVDAGDGDAARLMETAAEAAETALQAPEPKGLGGLGVGLVLAFLLAFPARSWLGRLGRRKSGEAVHPGLARTAAAVWIAAVDTGLPALGAIALHLGAQWGGLLSDKADALADAAVIAVTWAAAILALGHVLATDPDPNRRLLPLPDPSVGRIRAPLVAVAFVSGAGFLVTRVNYVIGASVAATIAANCVLSLAYAAVAGLILVSFDGGRAPQADPAAPPQAAPAWTLVSLFLTCAIVITLGAVFAGYTTLAMLTSSQIFWLSVIMAATYLLLRFVDDVCAALFSHQGWAARLLFALFSLRRSTINQAGLLISAGLQLVILIGALSLALTPFGQSGDLLIAHLTKLGGVIHLGSATISPAAIAAGFVTLLVGVGAANLVQNWVNSRYLPVTDWDAGVRNSVSTGVGYLGVIIAIVCAFSATGLGFKQFALVASALSVGIGFGLQQIVQNFVSGIILLVERPVKVGDWVNVGGIEGDIRRIRVRATEIGTFDRSTVIVPNSDLITKAVQNKTLGEPRSRIQLQVPIAKREDAAKARDLLLQVAKDHPRILGNPTPRAYIDSVAAAGSIVFNCYFYVDNPREAYQIRSDLYFILLEAFQRNDVAFPTV